MKNLHKLCCCLLMVALLSTTVLAAGQGVTLESSAQTVQPGDTFTVDAILDGSEAIAMASVALDFDEDVFELTGGTCHVADVLLGEVLPKDRVGMFVMMLPKKVSGKIFTFQFRVKDGASRGTYEINAESTAGNLQGSEIPSEGVQVKIGCAHTPRNEWHTNQAEHWHICKDCGQRMDIAGHVLENQSCTICAYQASGGQAGGAEVEEQNPVPPSTQPLGQVVTPSAPQDTSSQNKEETAPIKESDPEGETTQPTEQTQVVLPTQNEEQKETAETVTSTEKESPQKTGKLWWIVILLILSLGVVVVVIWNKKK